jgi:hypothetical protein
MIKNFLKNSIFLGVGFFLLFYGYNVVYSRTVYSGAPCGNYDVYSGNSYTHFDGRGRAQGTYSYNPGPPPCSPSNGVCNSKYVNTFISSALSNSSILCASGSKTGTTISGDKYKWTCRGSCGGSTASCQAKVMPQVGKCSSFFELGKDTVVQVLPTDSKFLCSAGTPKNITQNDNYYTWICEGSGGSVSSDICRARITDDAPDLVLIRVEKLEVTARITPPIVNPGEYCNIVDIDYKTNAGADTSLVSCNIYRNNIVHEDRDPSKLGHQVEPKFEYIFKCIDVATGLQAQTKPMTCVLNPVINER